MKIVIVGPGALGCLLAAFLSRAKEEIWLLDKDKERASHLDKHGIHIEGLGTDFEAKLKATAEAQDIGKADLIVICVKSYSTKNAVTQAKPIIGPDTKVITLQNGIGNIEMISEVVGQEKVIGGVTNLGATLLEPGKVKYAGKGETVIGRIDGKIPVEMRSIRQLFNKAGLEMRLSRDIKALLWSKLIINV
ncbi:MAG: ketopantoate reductase family protein, partial [Candidatus Omnitrophica bacterium]|nr:ketopantoate reductase family protein [Candidatus Omnitrophota bacterium]